MDSRPVTTPPEERAAVDASLRAPVLFLWAAALGWLLLASAFHLLASIQAHSPTFLAGSAWLSYGRLELAARAAWCFGWAAPAGLGAALWVLARLGRVPLPRGGARVVTGAGILANAALLAGTLGLLRGESTGVAGLELPPGAALALLAAHALIAGAAVLLLLRRRAGPIEVPQLYLLGAAVWYPATFAAGEIALVFHAAPGPVEGIVAAWVAGSFLTLWLAPLGLGLLYYLVPKLLGRPVASAGVARLGFWMLALCGGWAGAARLADGPFPAWLPSAGIAATVALAIPAVAVALNLLPLLGSSGPGPVSGGTAVAASPVLRFGLFALAAFLLGEAERIVFAFRSLAALTRFTYWEAAWDGIAFQGFAAMALFAAFYYIAPRLAGREWASLERVRFHFWGAALGVLLGSGALMLGGLIQGLGLRDRRVPFAAVVDTTLPFLWMRSFAEGLALAAYAVFALSFLRLVRGSGPARSGPLLFPIETHPGP